MARSHVELRVFETVTISSHFDLPFEASIENHVYVVSADVLRLQF